VRAGAETPQTFSHASASVTGVSQVESGYAYSRVRVSNAVSKNRSLHVSLLMTAERKEQ